MYSTICTEWAADHYGHGLTYNFGEDMRQERFLHFNCQWPCPL